MLELLVVSLSFAVCLCHTEEDLKLLSSNGKLPMTLQDLPVGGIRYLPGWINTYWVHVPRRQARIKAVGVRTRMH